ncbi:RNA polymerase subunit sigma-70 [Glycomyces fuscus]|nr:RNA polymerase subunit sigma-70 [Glycomyces fuscus]
MNLSTQPRGRGPRVDWQELTDLTHGQPFVVERVRLTGSGVAVEGRFEPPQLAQLSAEDQVFVAAFVRSHGSIKEMERIFGVSYPTIKSRLNRLAERLDFVDTDPAPTGADVIDRLRRGEISAQEALAELERPR